MSAVFVQKQGLGGPFGDRQRVRGPQAGSALAPAANDSGRTALQNPEATVAEIRDALLIEAGYPPVG